MNGKHELLVYADDVDMLGENSQTVRENTEIFIKVKEIGLEVNSKRTKYMITSRHQNVVQNGNVVIGNLSFENMGKFKYLSVCVCKVFCLEAGLSLVMHYQGSTYLSLLDKKRSEIVCQVLSSLSQWPYGNTFHCTHKHKSASNTTTKYPIPQIAPKLSQP